MAVIVTAPSMRPSWCGDEVMDMNRTTTAPSAALVSA